MSTASDSAPRSTFRNGTPDDWPTIAEIVAKTPGWGNYLNADVWQDWIADTNAGPIVMEHAGKVIAFSRLSKLGEAEWWLEEPRTILEHQAQTVFQSLVTYMVERFRQHGDGLLRFTTSNKNSALIKVASELGFRHRISYVPMEASAQPNDFHNFKLLQAQNDEMIWQYLRRSPMYRINHFVEGNQTLCYLTPDRLVEYLATSRVHVVGWRQFEQLHGLAILLLDPVEGSREAENVLRLGYLDAPDDTTLRAMLLALRGLAVARDHERLAWKMPLGVGLERPVADTELQRTWDGELQLFELPLRV